MASLCKAGFRNGTGMEENVCKRRRSVSKQLDDTMQTLSYAWVQNLTTINIQVQLRDRVLLQQGAAFNQDQIQIRFQDGGIWQIQLYKPIKPITAEIKLQKDVLFLNVKKEVPETWPHLEATPETKPAQKKVVASKEEKISAVEESMVIKGVPVEQEGVAMMEGLSELEESDCKENQREEEEPVYILENVNLGQYDTPLIYTVQIYVKAVCKESVKVFFEPKQFSLMFKTGDAVFLRQHPGSSKDTEFSWGSEVVDELNIDQCYFSVSPTNIQIKLVKANPNKWGSFEPSSKKEAQPSRSDSWIPTSRSQASTTPFSERNHVEEPKGSRFSVSEVPEKRASSTQGQRNVSDLVSAPTQESRIPVVGLGRIGLENRFFNCYLNAVLQVLAHTPQIRDYFMDIHYQKDLNRKLNCTNIVIPFVTSVRRIWTPNNPTFCPIELLERIVKRYSLFNNQVPMSFVEMQQDAHEVMGMVLDGLHEDLKREEKSTDDLPALEDGSVEAMGQRKWEITKAKDDSKVMDVFRGLYKSNITCMTCQKESCSFDPFTSHTLPIPDPRPVVHITFLWRDPARRPGKFIMPLPKICKLSDAKLTLSKKTGVKPNRMRVFTTSKGRVERFFVNDDEIITSDSYTLMVCEVLTEEDAGEKVWEIRVIQRMLPPGEFPKCNNCNKPRKPDKVLKRCQGCYRVAYCNSNCQQNHWRIHRAVCNVADGVGTPFIVSLPESKATYSKLVSQLKGFARYSVTIKQLQGETQNGSGAVAAPSGDKSSAPAGRQGSISPQLTTHPSLSNLSSSSSQSSGSLNSLDSQSSGNSTSTLTADVQQEDDFNDMDTQNGAVGNSQCNLGSSKDSMETDSCYSSLASDASLSAHCQKSGASLGLQAGVDAPGSLRSDAADSGGAGDEDVDDEVASIPTAFYIKPVTEQGGAMKGANRFEDKGDEPLDLSKSNAISMDWKVSCDVQTKEIEADVVGDADLKPGFPTPVTLEQCLQTFMENEYLEGSNGWHCPQCKKVQRAAKHMSLWKLPPVLLISLKRFHRDNFGRSHKEKAFVDFPVSNLDLREVCSGEDNKDSLIYDLYAVIDHEGEILRCGHYKAFIRCSEDLSSDSDPRWVCFNDTKLSYVDEASVVSENAYILMYRLRQPSAVDPARPTVDGDNKAAEPVASVASEKDYRERKEAWAAKPDENGVEEGKEKSDDEAQPVKDMEDEDMYEDPMDSPAKWAQAVNRVPGEEVEKMDEEKVVEMDDLDAMEESDLNNSCPGPVEMEVKDPSYTDMDSLD